LPEALNCLFVSPYMKMLRHALYVSGEQGVCVALFYNLILVDRPGVSSRLSPGGMHPQFGIVAGHGSGPRTGQKCKKTKNQVFQRPAIFLDTKLTSHRILNRCPIPQIWTWNAIAGHETPDISLSSGTSTGTFACSAGP